MKHSKNSDEVLLIRAGEGRTYNCGKMTAVFKADENETNERYSISEWWIEPHSDGPGAHLHEHNDEVFYGIEGVTTVLVGEEWISLGKGDFVRIPANTMHDFCNRTAQPAAVLNFFIPGGFERNMPSIVEWFKNNAS